MKDPNTQVCPNGQVMGNGRCSTCWRPAQGHGIGKSAQPKNPPKEINEELPATKTGNDTSITPDPKPVDPLGEILVAFAGSWPEKGAIRPDGTGSQEQVLAEAHAAITHLLREARLEGWKESIAAHSRIDAAWASGEFEGSSYWDCAKYVQAQLKKESGE